MRPQLSAPCKRVFREYIALLVKERRTAANDIPPPLPQWQGFEGASTAKKAYYGILGAQLQKQAAEQNRTYERARLSEAQQGVRDGSALNVDVLDGQAGLLQSEQSLLTINLRLSDLNTELDDLLGYCQVEQNASLSITNS
jgi:hypothetical protein